MKGKCEECGSEYSPIYEGIPLCENCDAKNWIEASSPEGLELLKNDPLLGDKIGRVIDPNELK